MQLGLGLGLGRYSGETDLAGEANVFQDAAVAYSLQDLGLGAESIVRVRRSLDNLEQDFKATEITDGTLTTFCGVGDGFVSRWYNQRNGDFVSQNNTLSMPLIFQDGQLRVDKNGNPSMFFDGVDDFLENNTFILNQPFTFVSLLKPLNDGIGGIISSQGGRDDAQIFVGSGGDLLVNCGSNLSAQGLKTEPESQNISSSIINGSLSRSRIMLEEKALGNPGKGGFNGLNIGSESFFGDRFYLGDINQIILYPYEKSNDETLKVEQKTGKDWFKIPNSVNLFIQGGQSNSGGRVETTRVNTPVYLQDNIVDGVQIFNSFYPQIYNLENFRENGVSVQSSGKFSFGDVALKNINDSINNVMLCKVALGGTTIAIDSSISWNADYENIPEGGRKLLQELQIRFEKNRDFLLKFGVNISIKAFLWHQGEGDSINNRDLVYQQNWQAIIDKVRDFTKKPNLPIIYGTISENSASFNSNVKAAQLNVSANDSNIFCRDNSTLTLLDPVHFDAESSVIFGEWAKDIYLNNY